MMDLLLLFYSIFIRIVPLTSGSIDQLVFTDHTYDENIKTVMLFKEGWNLSYPLLKFNSTEKLNLHFDLLGEQKKTYYYTFIHCDKDWKESDIFTNEYLEGFPENELEDYKPSFNTTVNYIHYKLTFPNGSVRFTRSGNYIVMIYPYGEPDNPVITRRFIVYEDAVRIDANIHRPQMTSEINTSQQVDINIDYYGLSINDPYRNIYAFILQNGRWNIAKENLKPDFFGNNELKYTSLSDKIIFKGGNEFRYFDIRSIRHQSEFVKSIDYVFPNYHILLHQSENREFKPYFYWQDFNGKYYIGIQEGQDPDIDADYVKVYFTLPSKYMISGGNIYVSGAFNNWNLDKNNLMIYNNDRGEYECTIMLKQGWYNYEYTFLKDGTSTCSATIFEGSHYETENDYVVIIYYRNPRDRYDRVIGSSVINTLNRITG
jgi:hypothetical protein